MTSPPPPATLDSSFSAIRTKADFPVRIASGRRGMILGFVLVAMIFLGLLAVAFHRVSRWAQHSVGRFQQGELLRRVVDAGIDEAFSRVWKQLGATAVPEPAIREWLLQRRPMPFPLALPLTKDWAEKLVAGGRALRISASLAHTDFRNRDSRGNLYTIGEGVGTVAFRVLAELLDGKGNPEKACTIVRYHDFKILAVASPAAGSARTGYAQHFPLDYHLLVRNGLVEFVRTQGLSLNPRQQSLILDQVGVPVARRGGVFFGGTGRSLPAGLPPGSPDHVFLNVTADAVPLLPRFPPREILRVDRDACIRLLPDLQPFRSSLGGLEGVFTAYATALAGNPLPTQDPNLVTPLSRARAGVQAGVTGAAANLFGGVQLLGPDSTLAADPTWAESILQGRIRQRFLYGVTFHLDLNGVAGATPAQVARISQSTNRWPSYPLPGGQSLPSDFRDFLNETANIQANRSSALLPVQSQFQSGFSCKGGQDGSVIPANESFPAPRFYDFTGGPIGEDLTGKMGFRPFRHYNLFGRRFVTVAELENAGIIDRSAGVLNLRGLVSVDEDVELGDDNRPWTVQGQGILVASGFRLRGGVNKASPGDLGVLYARRGDISIETGQEIQLGLIAINDGRSGKIRATRPIKVFGNLVVDELDLHHWSSAGPHVIRYDPAFRVDRPLLQIHLSPWITFQRVVEGI